MILWIAIYPKLTNHPAMSTVTLSTTLRDGRKVPCCKICGAPRRGHSRELCNTEGAMQNIARRTAAMNLTAATPPTVNITAAYYRRRLYKSSPLASNTSARVYPTSSHMLIQFVNTMTSDVARLLSAGKRCSWTNWRRSRCGFRRSDRVSMMRGNGEERCTFNHWTVFTVWFSTSRLQYLYHVKLTVYMTEDWKKMPCICNQSIKCQMRYNWSISEPPEDCA